MAFSLMCILATILHIIIIVTGIIWTFDSVLPEITENLGTIGIILLVAAGIGLLGYIFKVPCLLIIYAISLTILSMLFCYIGIAYFLSGKANKRELAAETYLRRSIQDPRVTNLKDTEIELKCCGLYGPDFYVTYEGEDYVPPSCCPNGYSCNKRTAYQKGCVAALRRQADEKETNTETGKAGDPTWGYFCLIYSAILAAAACVGFYYAGSIQSKKHVIKVRSVASSYDLDRDEC